MRIQHLLILMLLLSLSCKSDKEDREEAISSIDIDLRLVRFDSIFMNASPNDVVQLRETYPQFFPTDVPDSVWVNKRRDSLMKVIYKEVKEQFPTSKSLHAQLEKLFQHYRYYFPKREIPDIYTVAEYVDHRNKVLMNDNDLIISLDNYLGEDHRFYADFENYISKLQARHQILPDVVNVLSKKLIPKENDRSFIAQMIDRGKILYLKDRLIPFIKEHHRLGYTEEELNWANANEEQMWRYFVENELIFSTKKDLLNRFIYNGPFSKFYLKFDKESPPRLGRFIGREIVRAYAKEHPDVSLKRIMELDAETIYEDSKYKPASN